MEIGILPKEEIVDDLFGARDKRLLYLFLAEKPFLDKYLSEGCPGLLLDLQCALQLVFRYLAVKKKALSLFYSDLFLYLQQLSMI